MSDGSNQTHTQINFQFKIGKVPQIVIPKARKLLEEGNKPILVNKSTDNVEEDSKVVSIPCTNTQISSKQGDTPMVSIVLDHSFLKDHNCIDNFFSEDKPVSISSPKKESQKLKVNSFVAGSKQGRRAQCKGITVKASTSKFLIQQKASANLKDKNQIVKGSNINYYKFKMMKRNSDISNKPNQANVLKNNSSKLQVFSSKRVQMMSLEKRPVAYKLREIKLELPKITEVYKKY